MARKVETRLIDDTDGSDAVGTTSFAFDGVAYEIDLSDANYQRFAQAMGEWIGAGRKTSAPRRQRSSGGRSALSRKDNQAIREWARQNGHPLSDRGRVPGKVLQAYQDAHGQA